MNGSKETTLGEACKTMEKYSEKFLLAAISIELRELNHTLGKIAERMKHK